jgi:hypothetical protein
MINFTDKLHIAIFNTIMNHFNEMTRTGWTDLFFFVLDRKLFYQRKSNKFTQSQHG